MPTIQVNGVRLYYEDSGSGEETIVFSHGLLMSTRMYDRQVAAFQDRCRCIAYDLRGQGQSEAPGTGAIAIEAHYQDAVALLETLGAAPCHFVGLSMGGFVALRLAARRPDLLKSITVLSSSAEGESPRNALGLRLLNLVTRLGGLPLFAGAVMRFLFGRTFLADPARVEERRLWRQRVASNRRTVYRAVNGVIKRRGILEELPRIATPTLILVGEEDTPTPPERAERIHAQIRGSRLVRVPHAGHTLTVEAPEAVNQAIQAFLSGLPRRVTRR